jgi:hypothetical protein
MKSEKVDMAICHVDELRSRIRNVQESLAEEGEASEEQWQMIAGVSHEMMSFAEKNWDKIKVYSADSRCKEDQNVRALMDILIFTEIL